MVGSPSALALGQGSLSGGSYRVRTGNGEWRRELASALGSRRLSASVLLLAFAFGAAAWGLHHRGIPFILESGDACEYAEMARRLSRGEGFTTGIVYPAELWLGAGRDHPAVKFPPLWPALLALPFALFGASEAVVHGTVGLCFAALVAAAFGLATALAGRGAGVVAAAAVATSPLLLALSIDGVSEIPFALAVTLVFLLCAVRAHPATLGAACGLAYLTRYNGAILLPMALALLAVRRVPARSLLWCAGGFAAVALPWWLRNLLVAGSPFYSLLNLNLYIAPVKTRLGGSLFFQLEPDLTSGVAADPMEKLRVQLPLLLARFPLASANLAALVGVGIACWRRQPLALGFAGCALATLGVVATALAMGRYFAPFLPAMLALGTVGWARFGGRLRAPGLLLLVAAPLLPRWPAPLPDVALMRTWPAEARASGAEILAERAQARRRAAPCVAGEPLLLAQRAAHLVWQHDVVAIYAPARRLAVAEIARTHPVDGAHLPDPGRVPEDLFAPRPECGEGWYRRLRDRDAAAAQESAAPRRGSAQPRTTPRSDASRKATYSATSGRSDRVRISSRARLNGSPRR